MSGPWHLEYFTLWPGAGRLAALSAARQDRRLRYVPGELNGRPVGVVLRIEVDYGRAVVQQ